MSRIFFRRGGIEESISAGKNYQLWKFAKELNRDEIEAMVTILKGRLKEERLLDDDIEKVRHMRRDILMLSDLLKIKQRNKAFGKDDTEYLIEESKDVGMQVLNLLEYNNTEIYFEELMGILNELLEEDKLINHINTYDCFEIGTVIATEILDHYSAKYDDKEVIDFYDVNELQYIDLKIILKKWLDGNYW